MASLGLSSRFALRHMLIGRLRRPNVHCRSSPGWAGRGRGKAGLVRLLPARFADHEGFGVAKSPNYCWKLAGEDTLARRFMKFQLTR